MPALEFAVVPADKQNAAAAGGHAVGAPHEEGDLLVDQLLHVETVAALPGIAGDQMRLPFLDLGDGVRGGRDARR